MKEVAGVAKNQLLHRLFFTSSPCITTFCKSLIINNNAPSVELHRRCVWQDGLSNMLYCRYNAVPDGKDCVKCKYRTFDFSNSLPLALCRSASYGGHPSHALLHSAYFCKQKNSTNSKPDGLPSVALAKDGGC